MKVFITLFLISVSDVKENKTKKFYSLKFQKVLAAVAQTGTTFPATVLALEDIVQLNQNVLSILPNYFALKRQIEELLAAMQKSLNVEVTPPCKYWKSIILLLSTNFSFFSATTGCKFIFIFHRIFLHWSFSANPSSSTEEESKINYFASYQRKCTWLFFLKKCCWWKLSEFWIQLNQICFKTQMFKMHSRLCLWMFRK